MYLEMINSVEDLRRLDCSELEDLAREVRELIIDVISKNGGHLASSLGVVELTLALHYAYNTPVDKVIWDVGHQSYAHKIITGRKKQFSTIRKYKGLSGFPKMNESRFDTFNVGHSSTSLSLALGEAIARDLSRKDNKVIAVIGDGSLTGGMSFEALNHIGHLDHDLTIVLNDNEHSISKNVGAMSEYLTRIISGHFYNQVRKRSIDILKKIPWIGSPLHGFLVKASHRFKGMLVPGIIFEEMGLRYFGPVDGHNLELLIEIFERVKTISGPKIIHVITKKGKGYIHAETDPARFHGTGPFDKDTGKVYTQPDTETFSEIAGKTIAALAAKDDKIITVTAAMKLGTGLSEFEKKYPERFFDVGIAEQHAVTFAGALAISGYKPFVSIYSTFLQRAMDQMIHDVAAMNMPIKLLVDRAGLVGDDGETHHGLYDALILKSIPNIMILAPSNGEELRDMIAFASKYNKGPVVIRYPRGRVGVKGFSYSKAGKFVPGNIKKLTSGKDFAIFAMGDMVDTAIKAGEILAEKKINVTVVNILTLKPLDIKGIEKIVRETKGFITIENAAGIGGLGDYILCNIPHDLMCRCRERCAFPDEFVAHGSSSELFSLYGMDPKAIAERIVRYLARK